MSSYLPQLLAVLVPGGVQLVVFLGWLHRRIRGDEINHAFVFDVATNHLPHIYDALCAIAEQQGIVLDAPPAELSTDPKKTCIFFLTVRPISYIMLTTKRGGVCVLWKPCG